MSDFEALVEKAARGMAYWQNDEQWAETSAAHRQHRRDDARRALEAVGLPTLLEHVEAAEGALNEADSVLSYIVHRGELWQLSNGTQEQVRETLASVQKITRRRA